MGEVCDLRSGGSSTGRRTVYKFGPNFHEVRVTMEGFLRCSEFPTVSLEGVKGARRMLAQESSDLKGNFRLLGDWDSPSFLSDMLDFMESLIVRKGPVNICAKPHTWIKLTTNSIFYEWAKPDKVNRLINTDNLECFVNLKCKTNDQMMDWCGGANFYTCPEGFRHFLPSFFLKEQTQSANLFNLKRGSKYNDDLIIIGDEVIVCPCGMPRLKMEFVPHWQNFPADKFGAFLNPRRFLEMAGDKVSVYQIWQANEGFFILFYQAENRDRTTSELVNLLDSVGIGKTKVDSSRYIVVGTKVPFMWRGGCPSFEERC
jgi:hypothetical protein